MQCLSYHILKRCFSFVTQGCGMMTSEQLTVNPEIGSLDACGPINYKIPGIKNIPKDFKVSLLKEAAGGHKELYSSKVRICIYIQVFAVIFFDEKFSCMGFFFAMFAIFIPARCQRERILLYGGRGLIRYGQFTRLNFCD